MPCKPSAGIAGAFAHFDRLGCCDEPSALFLSKSTVNDYDPDAGKLWDPNQGELRGYDGATEGIFQSMGTMIIMTVMYPARVARFDLLKCVCFLAKR